MSRAVRLRPATPDDLEILQYWDRQPHVIAAKGNDDWQWKKELARRPDWREQLIAEVDGRPIGFVQVIDPSLEESQYWGCVDPGHRAIDIWIGDPKARNRGDGTQMMERAIEHCFADPSIHTILLDPLEANVRAHRFYERLGFEFVAKREFCGELCNVYRLRREGIAGTAN
jgi:aminoglycoside 6'-N-acetyltransferase